MINSLLIANRGEIAVRIIRSCREMGIRPIAVYSEADKDSLAVKIADRAVCIGPPNSRDSYLNMNNLISAAVLTGCDAVHPGVGFLAENAEFAKRIKEAGLEFIGPEPDVIRLLGDKVEAKRTALFHGVPVIPGSDGGITDIDDARRQAEDLGYPVIIKAAAGGGGKGMRIVGRPDDLADVLQIASTEAERSFSDGTVYIEKYLAKPRHVEIQLLAGSDGNVVHLGERDCTVQQNHQKLIEESPSPVVDQDMRKAMGEDAVRLFKEIGYTGAGTIEFLVENGRYYFMEVNARVQVEHPVTEMLTGVDIIREQILSCSGRSLGLVQSELRMDGYAVECRINASAPGTISNYLPPGGFKVRIDSFLYNGYTVVPFYDALVAKVIVGAKDREEGLNRMYRVLSELDLNGIPTNIDLQKKIIASKIFQSGNFGTDLLETVCKEPS